MVAACDMPANLNSAQATDSRVCKSGIAKGTSDAGLDQILLCIKTKAKTHGFTVEVAGTSRQQAAGLMFRTALSDDAGMIFPFSEPRQASFWMKNTVIPLDIIFVRSDGSIESIAENTVPYSTDPVASGEDVAAVLELRGGLTSELGIAPGDVVSWKASE